MTSVADQEPVGSERCLAQLTVARVGPLVERLEHHRQAAIRHVHGGQPGDARWTLGGHQVDASWMAHASRTKSLPFPLEMPDSYASCAARPFGARPMAEQPSGSTPSDRSAHQGKEHEGTRARAACSSPRSARSPLAAERLWTGLASWARPQVTIRCTTRKSVDTRGSEDDTASCRCRVFVVVHRVPRRPSGSDGSFWACFFCGAAATRPDPAGAKQRSSGVRFRMGRRQDPRSTFCWTRRPRALGVSSGSALACVASQESTRE